MATSGLISSKGQITIPVEIRHRLGVKPGDRVEFAVLEDGRTILRPTAPATNPFNKYIGALGGFDSRNEVNAWVSELRDDQDRAEDLKELRDETFAVR